MNEQLATFGYLFSFAHHVGDTRPDKLKASLDRFHLPTLFVIRSDLNALLIIKNGNIHSAWDMALLKFVF